ncbi:uncharacterized protein LOC114296056 isoform X1 [Camellia sinensis]|uniref:uncharacterized protein LOC114296056 isoform X1 n=1 Tax=Camellia sinensis TaxID=4442 RepID=UPI001036F30C|nr:uncharacterized protein LOC114296056 isoform X1 [Camellia sinensis]
MKKEFTVPPVIFPSGDTTFVSGGGTLHHRRVPTAPFQPPRPAMSSIPSFLSFDIGPTSFSVPVSGSDEPSLLEELEIDASLIYRKSLSLLNPFRLNPAVHDSADLSGSFLYYMSFCLFQMLAGKVQFGVVLGWIVVFSIFLYVVFNMLQGKNGNLDLYRSLSLVGYSLLPVVVFSALSLFIPQGFVVANFILAAVFVMWSTRVCSCLLLEGASRGDEHHGFKEISRFVLFEKPNQSQAPISYRESITTAPHLSIAHDQCPSISHRRTSPPQLTGLLFSSASEIRDTRWFWASSKTPFQWLPLFPPRHPPLLVTSEERLSCLFHLKSSTEDTHDEQGSAICLSFPENQGDALLLEVQDTKKTIHGRAIIPIASLTENPNDRIRWWQIYHDDHECVGKVQLSIGSTITSNETAHIKV